ncbi:hypothetical protein PAL_GLEAN10003220 [Pteropus alecto]|uniref:Spermatogenesis-associated protein 33 n=1 Tax=Pteropus alecto TaxID=9402 RepID=L5JTV1_PTEAL|nr:hypothetical protein PAL_GLEAN10003220 [Pteropus alecto]
MDRTPGPTADACFTEEIPHRLTNFTGVFFPLEKPDVKVKSSKKVVIPQITITTASNETLIGDTIGSEEQTTIREVAEWGAYSRHRNPSTADAYNLQTKE